MKKIFTAVGFFALMSSGVAFAQCSVANLSAWSVVNNAPVSENGFGSSLDVTAAAAMAGTACGLDVKTIVSNSGPTGGDSDKPYVIDDSPAGESRFRAAFCVNANNITIPGTGSFRKAKFHVAQCAAGTCEGGNVTVWRLVNLDTSGATNNIGIEFWVRDDNLPGTNPRLKKRKFSFDIPDNTPTRIEYDLNIANGSIDVWLDGSPVSLPAEFSNLALTPWQAGIQRARLGFIERRSSIPENQHYYLDEYESRRQTFIGGTCN